MRYNSIIRNFSVLSLIAALVFLGSCTKEEVGGGGYMATSATKTLDSDDIRMARQMMERMPEIGVWNEERGVLYKFNLQTREFSFADPNPGWNFSNNDGPTYIEGDNGGILIIPSWSFGGNTGGTVVAGSSAINIDFTFCFSASDEALGLDLFDYGGNFDGISMVLGIGGDFEALAEGNVDEDADFTDFFHGYALYFVYDNEASGSYDILNWLEDLEEDEDFLDGNGFSYVIDFQNFNLYFSADGTLNVSGGEMTFNGEYLGILELLESLDDEDEVDVELVPGFGTMGCN
jgi:hypothetical protein